MKRPRLGGLGSCIWAAFAAFGACSVPEGAEFYETDRDGGAGASGSGAGGFSGSAGAGGTNVDGDASGGDASADARLDAGSDARADAASDARAEASSDAGSVFVRQISAGWIHTCALLSNGAVRCWGGNSFGQLGYGHKNQIGDDEAPRAAGNVNVGGSVQQIAAGGFHTCALLTNGAVRCWGNGGAHLGYGHGNAIGDDEAPATAGDVDVGGTVKQLALGMTHTCALLTNGTVRCWGSSPQGQLGYGNTAALGDPSSAGEINLGGAVQQIAAGLEHTCAALTNGAVRCWGHNYRGVLGLGHTENVGDNEPPAAVHIAEVKQMAAGQSHTCALLTSGAVRCWGAGGGGVLGYGNIDNIGDNEVPAANVNVGAAVQQIATGYLSTCALLASGNVRCWGQGSLLGYGNSNSIGDNEAPARAGVVNVGGTVQQLAMGETHTCALLSRGAVRCWGGRYHGYPGVITVGATEDPAFFGDVPLL